MDMEQIIAQLQNILERLKQEPHYIIEPESPTANALILISEYSGLVSKRAQELLEEANKRQKVDEMLKGMGCDPSKITEYARHYFTVMLFEQKPGKGRGKIQKDEEELPGEKELILRTQKSDGETVDQRYYRRLIDELFILEDMPQYLLTQSQINRLHEISQELKYIGIMPKEGEWLPQGEANTTLQKMLLEYVSKKSN